MPASDRGCVKTFARVPPVGAEAFQALTSRTRVECRRHPTREIKPLVGEIFSCSSKIRVFTQVRRETGKE
jgi:hypothetical protein